jgi:hypothetical protein
MSRLAATIRQRIRDLAHAMSDLSSAEQANQEEGAQVTRIDRLRLTRPSAERRAQLGGYTYYVSAADGRPLTAFYTAAAVQLWAALRGLDLAQPLPDDDEAFSTRINGSYRLAVHSDPERFYALPCFQATRVLQACQYTLALLTVSADGEVTSHTMAPNCEPRVNFDFASSRAREDAGLP